MDSWNFFKQFTDKFREVGSIIPSSDSLGRFIADRIPRCSIIVEIGPGTGAITRHISEKAPKLLLIEPNQLFSFDLYAENHEVVQDKAENVRIPPGAVVVSTAPLKTMSRAQREAFLENIIRARPILFVQISYFYPTSHMDSYFEGEWELCFWNIPPTWVFFGRREAELYL